MRPIVLPLCLAATLLLGACADRDTAPVARDAASPGDVSPANPPVDRLSTGARDAAGAIDNEFRARCGAATFRLRQVARLRSELERLGPDGRFQALPAPPGLAAYSPLGIACTRGADGPDYALVEYGVPRKICHDCTWPVLFDARGQPLNGGPPRTRADGGFEISAFEALRTRLGLGAPDTRRLEWK